MKKASITINFEEEKLNAVQRYMQKKNTDLEDEMTAQLEKLYAKYVPAVVQEYLSERDGENTSPAPKRKNGGDL